MLSILHREMRVASRNRWTFRARLLTNVLAFVLSAPLIAIGRQDRFSGAFVFRTITLLGFFFCLIQGVRKAASSISDEKRDGTLGLLFLTDLTPLEIIGGKLIAIALPMVQPLLAFVPFLTVSMLIGGVTFGEIARVSLLFAVLLLFSISIGLFVSSLSKGSHETGNKTLALLFALVFIPRIPFWNLRLYTIWTAFKRVGDPEFHVNPAEFWIPIFSTFSIGALALIGAAFFLPRRWERVEQIVQTKPREPMRIGNQNPTEWLAARYASRGIGLFFFNFCIAILASCGALISVKGGPFGLIPIAIALFFVLLRLASQASYPLAEAKRSGAVEMLMSTPIRPESLITGQIASLWRQFRLPIAFLVAGFAAVNALTGDWNFLIVGIGAACSALWIAAVATMGMWMGLRSNTPNKAFFKTLLFGIFAPFIGCQLAPIVQLILFAVSYSRLSGRELKRLIGIEREKFQPTLPPIIAPSK